MAKERGKDTRPQQLRLPLDGHRIAHDNRKVVPPGDEDLNGKDLTADGRHVNFGGMPEVKIRGWRRSR